MFIDRIGEGPGKGQSADVPFGRFPVPAPIPFSTLPSWGFIIKISGLECSLCCFGFNLRREFPAQYSTALLFEEHRVPDR